MKARQPTVIKPKKTPKKPARRQTGGREPVFQPRRHVWQLEEIEDEGHSDIEYYHLIAMQLQPPGPEFNHDFVAGRNLLFEGVLASSIIVEAERFAEPKVSVPTVLGSGYRLQRLEYIEDSLGVGEFYATYKTRMFNVECGLVNYPDAVLTYHLKRREGVFETIATSESEHNLEMFEFQLIDQKIAAGLSGGFILVLDVGGDVAVAGGPDFSELLLNTMSRKKMVKHVTDALEKLPGYSRSEIHRLQNFDILKYQDTTNILEWLRGYQKIRKEYIDNKREMYPSWPRCPPQQSRHLSASSTRGQGSKRPPQPQSRGNSKRTAYTSHSQLT